MESCENIANTLKQFIFISLCREDLCQEGRVILAKLFELQFHSDVKIKVITDFLSKGMRQNILFRNLIDL
jgi:hypothetical protein